MKDTIKGFQEIVAGKHDDIPEQAFYMQGHDRGRRREGEASRRLIAHMAATFRLRIVTPERELVDEDVEEVVAPGAAGEFGILPDHIAFLTTLVPGRLIYRSGSRRTVLAIFGGYAEVADNVMTVLADGAQPVADIDVEAARRAAREAESALATLDPAAADAVAIRRAFDESTARIAAASEKL